MRLPLPATTVQPTTTRPRTTLNIAHRGASAVAPENTLAAVRHALAAGADLVEVDVQRTRDGALVLLHDTTLRRTTNARWLYPGRAPWRIQDFTLEEIRRLDAGSWKSGKYAGEVVPTLDEALEVVCASSAGLQLELKAPQLHPGVVDDLAAVLTTTPGASEAAPGRPRVVAQSFHFPAMKDLKTRLPQLPVGLLGAPQPAHLPALGSWADQVNPHHRSVDRAYVEAVHQHGMECLVWTVDRAAAMRRAARLGVDGGITNRPERLAHLLDGRG